VASTVTPGITAPDVSFTTPAIAALSCAHAAAGGSRKHDTMTTRAKLVAFMNFSP
jgi:hypothetical protein